LLPPDLRNHNNPHGWVQLVISDSGPGIARDHLRKVFDPYFTTKAKSSGTGLGLSVVSGIVRSYEGSVRVDSDPGNGARFEIFLPCVDPATAERDNRDQTEALPSGGTEFILIVDDEPAVIDVARQLLTRRGYRVVARSNAREALALLRSRPDDIDLVITDLTMPGISGIELARELKSWRADLPVILCSGYDADARRGDGIRPADCLIKKPFNIKELDVAIRRLLSERSQKKAAMHEISIAK
jgi:CheY-like chemotaxis protein